MQEFRDETREIVLNVPAGILVEEFDQKRKSFDYMKKVDVIIEETNHYVYIEFKNVNNPMSDSAKDSDLYHKLRDTFLFKYFLGKNDKDIHYFVLFAGMTLEKALMETKTNQLLKSLPMKGRENPGDETVTWPSPWVTMCVCHSVESWNKDLPQYPVRVERRSV